LNADFHKFPGTPHLAWLGRDSVREDKVFTPSEVACFLSGEVTVEEKIDGASLGISHGSDGQLRFQNRGNYLTGSLSGQWKPLRAWAAAHEHALREHLPHGHVLYGEWCHARHSIGYDQLPDWFLAFDIFDPLANRFWSSYRRNALLDLMDIHSVPVLAHGRFSIPELTAMLDLPSAFSPAPREGIYLRQEDRDWLIARAKLVRPEFVQHITAHWSKSAIRSNLLTGSPHV